MKKSVWFINKYSRIPTEGGIGSRDFMILKELAKHDVYCLLITSDSNHLAAVPVLTSKYYHDLVNGVNICWVKTSKYKVAKSFRRICSWFSFEWGLFFLRKKRVFQDPDVVVVSSLSLLSIFNGLVLKSIYRCRLVFEVRDIWPLTIVEEGGFSRSNPFVKFLGLIERLGYKKSDVIVGTMPNLQAHVEEVIGEKKQTYCIPMGVDFSQVEAKLEIDPDYKEKYFPEDKIIIAYVGTIGITNALDCLFECAVLLQNNSEIHFVIVGDGDLLEYYTKKAKNLCNVSFVPKVPKEMVPSVLAQCSILYFSTFPSKVWEYGQSLNKVIDYMLSGKPIICSYSGFPSMINEAECGLFVPAGNVEELRKAILIYASMTLTERNKIGTKGRKWIIENRNFPKLAQDYFSIMFPS